MGKSDGKVTLSTKLDTSGLKNAGSSIKSALAKTSKAVAAFGAAAAAAIGAAVKQSTDAYADYEQLTGGVETLFKGSADKVKKYAEEAYKTAGVSANQYMETVTSFSASLISSLGGDTDRAAEVANTALIDMSDNANKMGSSLESIQTAYQGFAKQQYQLLDNLKLGYGGTKTEMERLLKDAEAFSGVKYDINNLGDVYEAIHQIQTRLNITGTTAKEAATTIAGSGQMAKSAWQNVLTAIAGGGALDVAIENFVDSFAKYFDNVEPAVERALIGVGKLIERIGPQAVSMLSSAVIKALPSIVAAVGKMIMGIARGVVEGVKALFTGSAADVMEQQVQSIDNAADKQKKLNKEVKKTADEAKKALAGFDELNVLSSGAEEETSGPIASSAAVGAAVVVDSVSVGETAITGAESAINNIIQKILQKFAPLLDIDLSKLSKSFGNLKKSLSGVGKVVSSSLSWAYENVLLPLTQWAVEEVAPVAVDLLSNALDLLFKVIEALKPSAEWLWNNFLQPVASWAGQTFVDLLTMINDGLSAVGDWVTNHQTAVENIAIAIGSFAAAWGLVNAAMAIWNVVGGIGAGIMQVLTSPITLVVAAIGALIAIIVLLIKNWDEVNAAALACWGKIKSVWSSVSTWFNEKVVMPVKNFFSNMWNGLKDGAKNAWQGIKDTFSNVATFFGDIFKKAWQKVKDVFSTGGKIFDGIKDGIVTAFKTVVNGIIKGINKVVKLPFKGLNEILDEIYGLDIAGVKPFKWLTWRAPIPEIPYLAKGAVIPPNREFMAVLGDQKHGTNIEAPLDTIKQALAEVLALQEGGGEIVVTVNFTGDLAQLARVLKPVIETETRRKGGSLASGGAY